MWIKLLGIIAEVGFSEFAKKALEKTLAKKLLKVVKKWTTNLPHNSYVEAEAVWVDPFNIIEHTDNSPYQENLHKIIEANEVPSEEDWFEAFMEKWRGIKTNQKSPQSFFLLEENQVTTHIRDLAHKIYNELTQDPIKARRAIVDALCKKKHLNKIELEKNIQIHVRKQIEKQKNCKKYIPDIYCELDQLKDNARYFVTPVIFWPNVIEQINRLNFVFLNSLLNKFGLDEFKIEIPESLKSISYVKEIESKGAELVHLLSERIAYLHTLDESRQYYNANIGWMLEGAIHAVIRAMESIVESIHCICAKVFCITSKAGQGKTNFVCDLVETVLNKRSLPCLYFNARDFNYTNLEKMDDYIVKTICCDSQCCDFSAFLRTIKAICIEKNTTFTIIIDGLNEHTKIPEFSHALEKMIEQILDSYFVRIILTCRTEYFEQRFGNLKAASFKEYIYFCENINIRMHEVKKKRLLNGYFKFFNISCHSINKSVIERLSSDPLLLRIFCEAYGDHKATKKIELPTVYDIYKEELFNAYFEKKLVEIKQKDSGAGGLAVGYNIKYKQLMSGIAAIMVENNKYENIPVAEISPVHSDILEKILDEDIIIRKDLLTQDNILNPESEVINFTFDEFRDYLIAQYLVNNIFGEDPSKFNGLINELIVPDSPIAEGVSRFIFCISKRKNDPILNKLIKNTPWYDDVFLDGIFSVRDDLIDKEDIDIICQKFKQSFYESSFVIYSLMQRFDTDAFRNLNINVLITILIELNEDDYDKYIVPVFEKQYDHAYERYFTKDIDNFTKQLSQILSTIDLIKERRFVTLFELLIYLFSIKDSQLEGSAYYLYNRFALEYSNYATEQLMKAVGTKNVFTEYYVWGTIINICENHIVFPESFVKAILRNLMAAKYDIHNRHSSLSQIIVGDSTEARMILFIKYNTQKYSNIFSPQEIEYINKHYNYFFPSQRGSQ